MATPPNKSSKIDLYKLIPTGQGGAYKSDPLVRSQVKNVAAVNNLGKTVNSLARVVVDIKKVTYASLTAQQKKKVKFKPDYNEPKKRKSIFSFLGAIKKGKAPGFLESLLNFLGGLIKFFIIYPVLKWLADKKNQDKVETGLKVLGAVFKALAAWAKFGVLNSLDGLYNMLRDDATWLERLGGFGQFLVGFGSLALGLRWLNPLAIGRTLKDFKFIGQAFVFAVKNAHLAFKALLASPWAWMFLGAAAIASSGIIAEKVVDKVVDYYGDDPTGEKNFVGDLVPGAPPDALPGDWFVDANGQIWVKQKFNSSNGGWSKSRRAPNPKIQAALFEAGKIDRIGVELQRVEEKAAGGWIHGPQSGYPVSLDGKGLSFIGHGTEYVARDSGGRAFVVPYDTPATRRNSNLTSQRLSEARRGGFSLGGLEKAVGGMVDRRIQLGWTGTDYNFRQPGNYNAIFQGNGEKVQTSDYDLKRTVGLTVAAMGGEPWKKPPTTSQLEAMMKESARIAMSWGWQARDVTEANVRTNAEHAAEYGQGPVSWGGDGSIIDLFKLRKGDADGSGGNRLRAMMRKYMNYPGKSQLGEKKSAQVEDDLLQRLILAEARGEGELGMALVARSVLNRRELIKLGGNPGLFGAKGHTLTDIINARNQYQPVRSGSIDGNWSAAQRISAQKAIALAKSTNALRDRLRAAGYDEGTINKLIGSTGFRGTSSFEDASQNINPTKVGNHIFNMAGNESGLDLMRETRGHRMGDSTSGGSIYRDRRAWRRGGRRGFSNIGGGGVRGIGGGSGGMTGPMPGFSGTSSSRGEGANDIKKQSEERNRARREMNRKTLEIVQQALAAVEKQNAGSRQWVSQANAIAQQVLGSANTPTVIGGGGGRGGGPFTSGKANNIFGTAVGILNSFNNPLKGIFR